MKRKIVGCFVCLMLIITILPIMSIGSDMPTKCDKGPLMTITRPMAGYLYLNDKIEIRIGGDTPIIIGPITWQASGDPIITHAVWSIIDKHGDGGEFPNSGQPDFEYYFEDICLPISPKGLLDAIERHASLGPLYNSNINISIHFYEPSYNYEYIQAFKIL